MFASKPEYGNCMSTSGPPVKLAARFAREMNVPDSYYHDVNVGGTRNVLEAAPAARVVSIPILIVFENETYRPLTADAIGWVGKALCTVRVARIPNAGGEIEVFQTEVPLPADLAALVKRLRAACRRAGWHASFPRARARAARRRRAGARSGRARR